MYGKVIHGVLVLCFAVSLFSNVLTKSYITAGKSNLHCIGSRSKYLLFHYVSLFSLYFRTGRCLYHEVYFQNFMANV